MRSSMLVLAFVAGGGSFARADGAQDEVSAGSTQTSASSPRSAWTADKLGGIFDPSDAWQVRFDVTATHDFGAQPSAMSTFGDSGGTVVLATASLEFDPDDHWSLRAIGGGSPSSTTDTTTSMPFQTQAGAKTTLDAQLRSTAASATGAASIGYDTAGDGALEAAFVATGTINYFDTVQSITQMQTRAGQNVTTQQIGDFCAAHKCGPQLEAALMTETTKLVQTVVDGNATAQLYRDTDLTLDGAYYFYNEDPSQLGYFSVAAAGRTTSGGSAGIAPLQYSAAPSLVHRFGQLMASATVQYGKYVAAEGTDVTGTLKVQYRFKLDRGSRLKLWGKLAASRDVDGTGTEMKSGYAALGAQYTW